MAFMTRLPLLALLTPALCLTAAERLAQVAALDSSAQISVATAQQAAQVEAALARNPDDLSARSALMAFYSNTGDEPDFARQLLWTVENHPEAPSAAMPFYGRAPSQNFATDKNPRIRAAWERALALHPDSPGVLFNGALFIERRDPQRALSLLVQAKSLSASDDHERCLGAIATIYAAAMMPHPGLNGMVISPTVANTLRSEIATSTNPALLSKVGTALVRFNEDREGLRLIQRAIELDPNNPQWQEALESAKAEPVRRANLEAIYGSSRQR